MALFVRKPALECTTPLTPRKKPDTTPYALRARPYPRAVNGRFPACPFCETTNVVKAGYSSTKKQVYRCKECGRRSYGYITLRGRPPGPWAKLEQIRPTRYRCPHCGGRCWKRGHAPNGTPKYLCKECRRENTGLIARPARPRDGPFPHRMTFHLNPQAYEGLQRCRARHNDTLSGSVRRILREAAHGIIPMSLAHARTTEDGRRLCRLQKLPRSKRPPLPIPASLPGEVAVVQRHRIKTATIYRPCFMNIAVVTVWLDDLSLSGLLTAARTLNTTRLAAARFLIARAGQGLLTRNKYPPPKAITRPHPV